MEHARGRARFALTKRGVAALLPAVALALSACTGSSGSEPSLEIELQAAPAGEGSVRSSELDRSAAILEERFDLAGIPAAVTRGDGSRLVVRLERPRQRDAARLEALATATGRLELYDLERNLVAPSIDAHGFPVAVTSLYDLLVGRQPPAREDDVESWYLFDPQKRLAGGPDATKRLLLRGGRLLRGWRILGAPPGTVVLECGIGEVVCPGVTATNPDRDAYYLLRYDPPRVPELDGDHVERGSVSRDVDPSTGAPVVVFRLTRDGAERFGRLTREQARRGMLRSTRSDAQDQKILQHVAIALDREIKSWPSIDWEAYPNGIDGRLGVQIGGIESRDEAAMLANVLRSGTLPAHLEVVARRTTGD